MICIRSIELTNVKNVGHGRIEFRDSPFGTRVTGIYGQNGSGKTTVVDEEQGPDEAKRIIQNCLDNYIEKFCR